MRKRVLPLLIGALALLASCGDEMPKNWTSSELSTVNRVLNGAQVPFYYIGETYTFSYTEQPTDPINSVSFVSGSQPEDFDIRYYVRPIEEAGYTGLSSQDDLLFALNLEIPTLFASGVYTEEIEAQFLVTLDYVIALIKAYGVSEEIPVDLIKTTFLSYAFPRDSIFIFAAGLGDIEIPNLEF